jgi:predicted PurR-regulated permease PerM
MRVERQVLFWLTAALLLLVAAMALRAILLPFVAGFVIAYFLNPLAERLTRIGLGRTGASALIVAGLGVLLVLALLFVVPLLVNQLQQLANTLPGEAERLAGLLEGWARDRFGARVDGLKASLDQALAAAAKDWGAWIGVVATSLWSQGRAFFNFVSLLLVTPLVVFYMLVDWQPMLDRVDGWLPREHAPAIRRLGNDINEAVSAFIRGQGAVCMVLGLFYAVALSVVGLRYGLVIGIATGLLAFVPFVGWALGLITATGLAVVQFWPSAFPILAVVGIFLAGQALDAGFLSPKIVGSKIGLHPVWLIFSLFVFSYLFGFVGVLVAVPVAAAVGVLVRFAIQLYLDSSVYQGGKSGGGAAQG